jgi:hypothetical protein
MNEPPRPRLTFAQREGVEPMPTQLELKVLSPALRRQLWGILYKHVHAECRLNLGNYYLSVRWKSILYDYYIGPMNLLGEDFPVTLREWMFDLQTPILDGDYVKALGLLEWLCRHPSIDTTFRTDVARTLERGCAAYRLIEETIVPVASPEEANQFAETLALLSSDGPYAGARAHLLKAAAALTAGSAADSIRESIHAVEAAARTLEPSAKTLGVALAALERRELMHGALKEGFLKLYGYTSDEKGIRHSLVDAPKSPADETDAIFMIGACASFVSYLVARARDLRNIEQD